MFIIQGGNMKLRIENLIDIFPNDRFAVEIFDTISIGTDSLSDIASVEYNTAFLSRKQFLDFYDKHKDKIDLNKYFNIFCTIYNFYAQYINILIISTYQLLQWNLK